MWTSVTAGVDLKSSLVRCTVVVMGGKRPYLEIFIVADGW